MASPTSGRPGLVLAAMTTALAILTIDVTVVRVALPDMQRDLGLSDIGQQWVVNSYLLALSVAVIAGGRAGDLLGRRRVLLAGMGLFVTCSVLSGAAQSEAMLIAARTGQGLGAAVMTPATVAIVTDTYAGPRLGWAIGVLAGAASVALSLGPLLGGMLTEWASWRWIFFINVPVVAVATALTLSALPRDRPRGGPAIDWPGFALLTVGLSAIVVGLMQAQEWSGAVVVALFVVGAVALAGLVAVELRVAAPLVDMRMIARRAFAAGNGVAGASQFAITSTTVFVAIYAQSTLGESPLAAGAMLLPVTLPVMVLGPLAGKLSDRIGARLPATIGMALCSAGAGALALAADSGSPAALIPGLLLFGIGFAAVLTTLTAAVMGGARADERGMASGIFNTVRNVGATLGVAVTSAVFYAVEADRRAADGAHVASEDAFAAAMIVVAVVALAGAIVAATELRSGPRSPAHAAD